MIGMPALTRSRMWPGRVIFSSGSAGPITSNAMLSAPAAFTFRSTSHRDPAALSPAARRYSSGFDHRDPKPVRTSTTSSRRTSTWACLAARPGSAAARGRRCGLLRATRADPGRSIPVAVDDAAARQVVGRQLDADAIPGRDADEVATHTAGRIGNQLVAALDLDLEHRVRQSLRDDRVHDYSRLFLIAVVTVR